MSSQHSGGQGQVASTLVVLEHRIINKQIAYLILNGSKQSWVKLCEANDQQTNSILKYESQKNRGVEPSYYPEAENNEEARKNHDEAQMKSQKEYNLRERELLSISMFQFYGIEPKEEKKQVITKSKRQITKSESRPCIEVDDRKENKIEAKKQQAKGHRDTNMAKVKPIKKGTVIDVDRPNEKRKKAKKQVSNPKRKEKNIEIEIYDGSDSELKML